MGNNTYTNNFLKANDLYKLKKYKDAIKCYQNAITEDNHRAESYYNIGTCYIKIREYENALIFLKLSIDEYYKIDASPQKIYFNIGYCYSMIEDAKNAYLNFNIAWSLDNEDENCKKAIMVLESRILKKN